MAFLEGISRQALEVLAALHRQQPLDVLGPIKSSRQELARWRDSVAGVIEDAGLNAAFALLDSTAPEPASPAPCHGDPKFPNMLWQDGRLTALLDWELAFNGDPRWTSLGSSTSWPMYQSKIYRGCGNASALSPNGSGQLVGRASVYRGLKRRLSPRRERFSGMATRSTRGA